MVIIVTTIGDTGTLTNVQSKTLIIYRNFIRHSQLLEPVTCLSQLSVRSKWECHLIFYWTSNLTNERLFATLYYISSHGLFHYVLIKNLFWFQYPFNHFKYLYPVVYVKQEYEVMIHHTKIPLWSLANTYYCWNKYSDFLISLKMIYILFCTYDCEHQYS